MSEQINEAENHLPIPIGVGEGMCIGFGATHARIANCANDYIFDVAIESTPDNPREFFGWLADKATKAAILQKPWVVVGFPGPVEGGRIIGPMSNVYGMRDDRYDLHEQLIFVRPEMKDVLTDISLVAVNDGELAAQAAARLCNYVPNTVGAIIVGTGVGAGIVVKDPRYEKVYQPIKLPIEVGHDIAGSTRWKSIEYLYSGPGIKRSTGVDPEKLPADNPIWEEEGRMIGVLALRLGLMFNVDELVLTGGVGVGASDKLRPHVEEFAQSISLFGNDIQQLYMPDIRLVYPGNRDILELTGAEGVMRATRSAQIH